MNNTAQIIAITKKVLYPKRVDIQYATPQGSILPTIGAVAVMMLTSRKNVFVITRKLLLCQDHKKISRRDNETFIRNKAAFAYYFE